MMSWRDFIHTFCYVGMFVGCALYLFILMVDPYDSVPFSFPVKREPISTNQRFAYPSLARNPSFDSVLIGTSTLRLLQPRRLNELTANSWVNLAMNSATPYEQMEMMKLFLRHHPQARNIVIGVDDAWCNPSDEIPKFTFRPFPPWMYDENSWNDLLYLFNDKALENSVRLVEYWMGKREAKYDSTGYRRFTEDFGPYNETAVSARLYPQGPIDIPSEEDSLGVTSPNMDLRFVAIDFLAAELQRVHNREIITLMLMPLHAAYISRSRDLYSKCKYALRKKLSKDLRIKIIDRLRIDSLTQADSNFWDPLHHTDEVAEILEMEISHSRREK